MSKVVLQKEFVSDPNNFDFIYDHFGVIRKVKSDSHFQVFEGERPLDDSLEYTVLKGILVNQEGEHVDEELIIASLPKDCPDLLPAYLHLEGKERFQILQENIIDSINNLDDKIDDFIYEQCISHLNIFKRILMRIFGYRIAYKFGWLQLLEDGNGFTYQFIGVAIKGEKYFFRDF